MSIWDSGSAIRELGYPFLTAMGAPAQGQGSALLGLLPMVAIVAIMYFIILRPMKRRQEKVKAFIEALKVGDKVVTSGGIFGRITRLADDSLQLEIADKVRVEVSRNAIVGYQGQDPVVSAEGAASGGFGKS